MNKEEKWMKVYKITQEDDSGKRYGDALILTSLEGLNVLIGDIEYEEAGNRYAITVEEMSKEECENLGEWSGF